MSGEGPRFCCRVDGSPAVAPQLLLGWSVGVTLEKQEVHIQNPPERFGIVRNSFTGLRALSLHAQCTYIGFTTSPLVTLTTTVGVTVP